MDLYDKYQIASFQDVFTDPNYWRIFGLFKQEPKIIVDCGGHCGHFAILADLCVKAKFGRSEVHYVLIEPDPKLQKYIVRNLNAAGLNDRFEVVSGVVGKKAGEAKLAANKRNPLQSNIFSSSRSDQTASRLLGVQYVDIHELVKGARIDLLKLDVEGAEFEFFEQNDDVLALTAGLVIEIHANRGDVGKLKSQIKNAGLRLVGPEIISDENIYAIYENHTSNGF